jgi:hypothetical protein
MVASAASATMGTTATAAAVTTTTVLSECWSCGDCQTDESCKQQEGSAESQCVHILSPSRKMGVHRLAREALFAMTALYYLIRFYRQARGCAEVNLIRVAGRFAVPQRLKSRALSKTPSNQSFVVALDGASPVSTRVFPQPRAREANSMVSARRSPHSTGRPVHPPCR